MSSLKPNDSLRYLSDDTHAGGKAESGGSIKIYHVSGDNTEHVATARHLGSNKFHIDAHNKSYDNHSDRKIMTAGVQAHHNELAQANKGKAGNLQTDSKQSVKALSKSESPLSKMDQMIAQLEELVKSKELLDSGHQDAADKKDKMDKFGPLAGLAAGAVRAAPAIVRGVTAAAKNPVVRQAAAGAVSGAMRGYQQSQQSTYKSDKAVEDKPKDPLEKPPVSEAQRRAMYAAARGESILGIPKSVGKEFAEADKGGKLPEKAKKEESKNGHLGEYWKQPLNLPKRSSAQGAAKPPKAPAAPAKEKTALETIRERQKMSKFEVLSSISVDTLTKSIRAQFSDSKITEMMKAAYDLGKIHYTTFLEWQNFKKINPSVLNIYQAPSYGDLIEKAKKPEGTHSIKRSKLGDAKEFSERVANVAHWQRHQHMSGMIAETGRSEYQAHYDEHQRQAKIIEDDHNKKYGVTPKEDLKNHPHIESAVRDFNKPFTRKMVEHYHSDDLKPVTKLRRANSQGSKKLLQPSMNKSEMVEDDEFELVEWDNGDFDIIAGKDVPEKYVDFIAKSMCAKNGCEEVKAEDDKAEKKDRCWDGYEPTPGKKPYEKGSCQPVKKSEMSKAKDMSGDDVDSSMMMGDLTAIKKHADEIMKYVDHDDVAPDWVKSKVSESASHLSAVADYVAGLSKSEAEEHFEKKKSFNLKAKHKSDKGGLTAEGRKAYNRATGSNLKAPQPQGGPRKRSFCARNKGQIDMHNIDCRKTPEKRACKARRRWKC